MKFLLRWNFFHYKREHHEIADKWNKQNNLTLDVTKSAQGKSYL